MPDGRAHAAEAGGHDHPWRARRRPFRLQAGLLAARRRDAARLLRPSRPGPVGDGRSGAVHARRERRGHGGAAASSGPRQDRQHRHQLWRHGRDGACRALSGRGLAFGADRDRGACGFVTRAQAIVRERGTPEQIAVCETLWAGGFTSAEQVQHYYASWGRCIRAVTTRPRRLPIRGRATPSPEPLNRAFGPGGFLRRFDLRPELTRITAPTLILAGRHDWICAAGVQRGDPSADPRLAAADLRREQPFDPGGRAGGDDRGDQGFVRPRRGALSRRSPCSELPPMLPVVTA